MFTHNRDSVDLNGTWKFCPDPMQRCRRQQWWRSTARKDSAFPCWDLEGLWEIQVPGTWKSQFEELKWYDGHAVYVRDFEVPEIPPRHEAFLAFDGIVYASEVYLNGQLVGKHEWGYSAFQVRVTEVLRKRNRLFVLVENIPRKDRVPGEIHDWNNDGGIINPVELIFVPVTHIRNFRASAALEGSDVVIGIELTLESRDRGASEEVTVRIPELNLEAAVTADVGQPARAEFRVPRAAVELWCPQNPKLYRTELSSRHETIADEIGYREIRAEGNRILLNGEPIRLFGIATHSEFKGTGRTATPEGIEMMVQAARELGVNFLRCAHYPYAAAFGRAMDRAGLMWWEEVPAYWLRNMDEEGQIRRACGMMAETVRRDWNRASLIVWSVSNECCWRNPEDPDDNNYPYWFRAVPMVRRMDPTRLVSCAEAGNMISVHPVWEPEKADEFERPVEEAESWRPGHADEWYALFDVLAANIYVAPGEAESAYRRYVEMFRAYNKPLMLSEFGSMSLLGADVPDDVMGSEERHCRIIGEAYEAFSKLPDLVGYCPWCLTDIRVPIHWRWYNQRKALFRYGVMDENWNKKKAFYALKECIQALKEQLARKE